MVRIYVQENDYMGIHKYFLNKMKLYTHRDS
jgi:hypothetical protein